MLKQATKLPGSKLISLDDGKTIGEIVDWIIDPDNKKISALTVKEPGLFKQIKVVTTIDVVEYGPGMVVVRNRDSVVAPKEVVRLKNINKLKKRIINSKVKTVSNKTLGTIEDLLFETTDSTIQKLYIKPPIIAMLSKPDLIIGADKIVKIEPGKITVQDDAGDLQSTKLADSSLI